MPDRERRRASQVAGEEMRRRSVTFVPRLAPIALHIASGREKRAP
jgi:hypothetical protein